MPLELSPQRRFHGTAGDPGMQCIGVWLGRLGFPLGADGSFHSGPALFKGPHEEAIGFLCLASNCKQQACPDIGLVVRQGILLNLCWGPCTQLAMTRSG